MLLVAVSYGSLPLLLLGASFALCQLGKKGVLKLKSSVVGLTADKLAGSSVGKVLPRKSLRDSEKRDHLRDGQFQIATFWASLLPCWAGYT